MVGKCCFAKVCSGPRDIQEQPLGGMQIESTGADSKKTTEALLEFTQQSCTYEHIPVLLSTNGLGYPAN